MKPIVVVALNLVTIANHPETGGRTCTNAADELRQDMVAKIVPGTLVN